MMIFWWLACARPIPEHLRLEPSPDEARAEPITDLTSAVAAVLRRDPLARSPYLPARIALEPVLGAEPLVAFSEAVGALEASNEGIGRAMQVVEERWEGTVAVPLSRGYRLRIAENILANGTTDPEQTQARLVELLTPLAAGAGDPALTRMPFAFLGPDASIRAYGERWVLESWLAGPSIPLAPLGPLLGAPQYDSLRTSPVGALIIARITGAAADPAAPWADLERATRLALTAAAADRDAEQAAWAVEKSAAAAELGGDPVETLLRRAAAGLTAAASRDRAAGGALLALAALRWEGACADAPCGGLDRVQGMRSAARWDPDVAALAACWQVLALKEALDSLEAGRATAMFPRGIADLADALIGTGAGAIEAPALRKARADAQVWLTVARAVGVDGETDWDGARVALGKHLARTASAAMDVAPTAELRDLLQRIVRRAAP